jgi:hypothetical protein
MDRAYQRKASEKKKIEPSHVSKLTVQSVPPQKKHTTIKKKKAQKSKGLLSQQLTSLT